MTVLDERLLGLLESVLNIIFEEVDLEWLIKMWIGGGDTCHDMIKIIYMLYPLKCRL
jgi:hypothetical protein